MAVLTQNFLTNLENNMQVITENTYVSLLGNLWYQKLCKELPSQSKKEIVSWLIGTGFLDYGTEGQTQFHDLATKMTEYENKFVTGSGLRLLKSQFEDLDGNGVNAATEWSKTMGVLGAYFPQQELAKAVLANPTAYDGVAFFHANAGGTTGHPVDPTDTSKGRFANLFSGAADANNPGACPIDASVTLDVAIANLSNAIAYIQNIKQPNGINPRRLKPRFLFVPVKLRSRALQVTGAKFIAQAAASGGGSADVSMIVDSFGLEVVVVEEFGAAYGGSDTAYYIGCEALGVTQGAFTFVNREPFHISYHGPMSDAELARKREFEWFPEGRNVIGPGHPFLLFKA